VETDESKKLHNETKLRVLEYNPEGFFTREGDRVHVCGP